MELSFTIYIFRTMYFCHFISIFQSACTFLIGHKIFVRCVAIYGWWLLDNVSRTNHLFAVEIYLCEFINLFIVIASFHTDAQEPGIGSFSNHDKVWCNQNYVKDNLPVSFWTRPKEPRGRGRGRGMSDLRRFCCDVKSTPCGHHQVVMNQANKQTINRSRVIDAIMIRNLAGCAIGN